jgi:hypothetical protein
MGQSTAEVRRDIERTRGEMSETIDAIADRTSPSRVLGRQRQRFVDRFRMVRTQVMGTADQVRGTAQDAAQGTQQGVGQLADKARQLPDQAREQLRTQAQGNPLAAGIIAFGGGLLAASLIPSSRAERRVAGQVRQGAQPAIDELKDTGRELADEVKRTAEEAAGEVSRTASESAQRVADDARSAASEVREEAGAATGRVTEKAQQAVDETRQ